MSPCKDPTCGPTHISTYHRAKQKPDMVYADTNTRTLQHNNPFSRERSGTQILDVNPALSVVTLTLNALVTRRGVTHRTCFVGNVGGGGEGG